MRPAYLRSDFEEDAGKGLLIFVGIVLSLCSLSIGMVVGYETRDWLQREAEKNKPLQARPVVQNPPPQLLPCNSVRDYAQEWDRTCRARFRSGKVGGL